MYIFFFVFIVCPYLIFTGVLCTFYLVKKNRTIGYFSLFLLCLPILLITIGLLQSRTKPSKADILGYYKIDRSRYPGKQADWQYETYSLEIKSDRVIVKDSRTETEWESQIEWFHAPEYRWKFSNPHKRHHIISSGPAIYRESFTYYYVFHSPLYGDMFFKKK